MKHSPQSTGRAAYLCLMKLVRPLWFICRTLITIYTKKYTREWIRSRKKIILFPKSMRHTAARRLHVSPIRTKYLCAIWWRCSFLYREPGRYDIVDCCAQRRLHEVAEKRLLPGRDCWTSMARLYQSSKRWEWPVMSYGTTAPALHV